MRSLIPSCESALMVAYGFHLESAWTILQVWNSDKQKGMSETSQFLRSFTVWKSSSVILCKKWLNICVTHWIQWTHSMNTQNWTELTLLSHKKVKLSGSLFFFYYYYFLDTNLDRQCRVHRGPLHDIISFIFLGFVHVGYTKLN